MTTEEKQTIREGLARAAAGDAATCLYCTPGLHGAAVSAIHMEDLCPEHGRALAQSIGVADVVAWRREPA